MAGSKELITHCNQISRGSGRNLACSKPASEQGMLANHHGQAFCRLATAEATKGHVDGRQPIFAKLCCLLVVSHRDTTKTEDLRQPKQLDHMTVSLQTLCCIVVTCTFTMTVS
jgi:hypothetical protein